MDFTAIVSAALAEGLSEEEIAAKLTDALNKSKKVEPTKTEREEYIDSIRDDFNRAARCPYTLTLVDAAALVFLCLIDENKTCQAMTTRKELDQFFTFIDGDIKTMMDKWKIDRSLSEFFGEMDGKHECSCGCSNKSKKEERSKGCGTDRKLQSDREIIEDFLKLFTN